MVLILEFMENVNNLLIVLRAESYDVKFIIKCNLLVTILLENEIYANN